MKIRFSIRDLLLGVLLVASTIAAVSFFNGWRQDYVDREFRTFRTLEKLRSLVDGDELSEVQLMFDDLMPLHSYQGKVVVSKPELSTSDEAYTVNFNESSARFLYSRNGVPLQAPVPLLHFRDGVLVNFTFTQKDMENSLKSLQTPIPQWYIQYGQWLIVCVLLAVVGLLRVVVLRYSARTRHNHGVDAEASKASFENS